MWTIWARALVFAGMGGFCASLAAQERVPAIVIDTPTQAYDPIRYEAAHMIADAWSELGLEVSVRAFEFSELTRHAYQEQNFDAVLLGWSGRVDRLDPQFFLGSFVTRRDGLGSNNVGSYSNPEFDALYDAQARTFDPDERADLVRRAQAVAARDAPLVVLAYRDEVVAYNVSTFANLSVTVGDGIYSDWNMMQARPLSDRETLRVGGPQAPDSLNPLSSVTMWGWKWMKLYYDTLVRLSPQAEPVMWAAESIDAVGDTVVEVRLRDGMRFHDGVPVTAADVAFSFDYYKRSEFAYFNAYLAALDHVEVLSEDVVQFILAKPSASFATLALSQIPILPQHIWEEIAAPENLSAAEVPVIGSGPFVFEEFRPEEGMRIGAFEEHFWAENIAIDGVDFVVYPDTDGVLAGLENGEIDMTAQQLETSQIPRAERLEHLAVVSAPDFGYHHLTFNTQRHAFGDVAFRRALSYAVDRERIVNVLLEGRGWVGSSVIAPINAFWHNPLAETFPFDLDKARAELLAGGYAWDEEGRLLRPVQ